MCVCVYVCVDEQEIRVGNVYVRSRKVPKSVCMGCGGGGGGGVHRQVIYVPSIKNQYKRVVFAYMVIY